MAKRRTTTMLLSVASGAALVQACSSSETVRQGTGMVVQPCDAGGYCPDGAASSGGASGTGGARGSGGIIAPGIVAIPTGGAPPGLVVNPNTGGYLLNGIVIMPPNTGGSPQPPGIAPIPPGTGGAVPFPGIVPVPPGAGGRLPFPGIIIRPPDAG